MPTSGKSTAAIAVPWTVKLRGEKITKQQLVHTFRLVSTIMYDHADFVTTLWQRNKWLWCNVKSYPMMVFQLFFRKRLKVHLSKHSNEHMRVYGEKVGLKNGDWDFCSFFLRLGWIKQCSSIRTTKWRKMEKNNGTQKEAYVLFMKQTFLLFIHTDTCGHISCIQYPKILAHKVSYLN